MATEQAVLHLRFEDLSPAEADVAAAELRDQIERSGAEIQVDRLKERADTQDFGATLVLVLGTNAAVILARAVHAWAARRANKVVLERPDGTRLVVIGDPAATMDVAATTAALQAQVNGG